MRYNAGIVRYEFGYEFVRAEVSEWQRHHAGGYARTASRVGGTEWLPSGDTAYRPRRLTWPVNGESEAARRRDPGLINGYRIEAMITQGLITSEFAELQASLDSSAPVLTTAGSSGLVIRGLPDTHRLISTQSSRNWRKRRPKRNVKSCRRSWRKYRRSWSGHWPMGLALRIRCGMR